MVPAIWLVQSGERHAALITAQYPLALYLHCASHYLNLAVVKSLQVTSVRNMMGVVDRVYVFFAAHPKRQRALDKVISETQPESSITKLKDLCRTRWIQRIDSLQVFQSLHISVVSCMEGTCSEGPRLWSTAFCWCVLNRDSISVSKWSKRGIETERQ